jgi:diguanylate cyclase (GGDEF)-like protein
VTRILIAEDDAISRRLLERTLEQNGHEVISVGDGYAAMSALLDPDGPRLAILDWMMPGASGLTVCREVRKRPSPYTYVIMLTGRDSPEDMVEGLDAGADDFLTKPFSAPELRSRVRAGARVAGLQSGLSEAHEQLRIQATRDDLTGLWNRRAILEHLGRELNRARHEHRPLTIALADLDDFKNVNDLHGHAAGDAVLKHTTQQMLSQLRSYDFMGRYGGEEFLILLPACDARSGRGVAERMRCQVATMSTRFGEMDLQTTVSLGLTWTCSADATPEGMIEAADAALYRAKANGRNRVED